MAIELDFKTIGKKAPAKIQVVNPNNLHRMTRVIGDLDHKYMELNAQEEAEELGLKYIDLYGFPIDTSHLGLISKENVLKYKMGVFAQKEKNLFLVTNELNEKLQKPLKDKLTKEGYTFVTFFCSKLSMDKLIGAYANVITQVVISDDISIDSKKLAKYNDKYQNFDKNASKYSTSELIERVLKIALDVKASDIHFEPEKEYYHIRLRLDGVLQDLAKVPKNLQHGIESRIKIISKLKLNVSAATQDGRFSFNIGGKDIDVRVSMLPSGYGYSIVMRLLGTDGLMLNMDVLGFSPKTKEVVMRAINKPQGMILTTGPTGSGKTTTLYTFLKDLNNGENKIITLEDPIEYKLEGVSQTQISAESNYTFANGLKSILRQDPDIVMVGEIRDLETAEIAVQAAFTGHQVLSTIHTNDATGSIPRMLQMGLKGYLIADSLLIAIGQRLVRKLCPYCKHKVLLEDSQKAMVAEELSKLPPDQLSDLPPKLEFYGSSGCEKCNNLGYKGRVGVYEVLEMSDPIRVLLSDPNISLVQVRQTARAAGMVTMFQDGLIKCLNGLTDIKELSNNVSR
jgi:type II secretory ATPase GspE/PulE/Tfp pilus assembly ATPase PilB-like protein